MLELALSSSLITQNYFHKKRRAEARLNLILHLRPNLEAHEAGYAVTAQSFLYPLVVVFDETLLEQDFFFVELSQSQSSRPVAGACPR